jgi:hypothetical protein
MTAIPATPVATPAPQPAAQPSLQDHVTAQKQAVVVKAQETVNTMHQIIDSWVQNFVMAEKVKTKRTDQVNMLLGFINQLANEGMPQINACGTEIVDPVMSNRVLECNNIIMTAAKNVLTNVQQQEAAFQAELQAAMNPPGKTEVKAKEA